MTPIKYVGKRPEYTDGTFGTRIHFKHGETKPVPDDAAAKMLRHPDVYVRGEGAAKPDAPTLVDPEKEKEKQDEHALQDARDAVNAMDKPSLISFAQATFGQKLPGNLGVDKMRQKVVGFIDQYGLP